MKLGVIGWPVGQSKSPGMQTAALAALGIAGEYQAYAVAPDALAAFVRDAPARGFAGVNVTIPHKQAALALCAPDALAARVGAVNTLVFAADGPPRGYNTDVAGFAALVAEAGGALDGNVVLFGAGGAARAVAAAVADGRGRCTLVARTPRPFVLDGQALTVAPWEPARVAALLASADLIVDATPRGLDGAAAAIDLAAAPAHAVVLDLVVARTTPLVAAANARGLRAATGAAMLIHQGAHALELWTGRAAPLSVMRAALQAQL